MRDPDLVVRAQRAATELELAWHRWRSMHGLGADPPSPVSSYVGYSLEEPWGQPRVLFGADAAEAEQLAAFLNRHDCAGPVHAAVTGLPGGQQQAALSGAWNRSNGGRVHVPAQGPAAVAERQQPGQRAGQRDRVPEPSPLDSPSVPGPPSVLDQPSQPSPPGQPGQPSPPAQPSPLDPASSLDTSSRTARPDGRSPQPTPGQDAPVFRAARKAQAARAAKAAKAARQAPHAEGQHAAQQPPAAEGQQAPEHPAAAAQHAAEAKYPAGEQQPGEQQAAAAQQAAEWLQAAQQLQAAQELRAAEEVRAAQELQAAAAHREVQAPHDSHQAAAVPSAPQMQAAGEALTRAASYVQPAEPEAGLGPALPPGLAAAPPVPAPSAPVTSEAAEMQPPPPAGQHAADALADEPYQDRYPARGSRISRGRSLPRLPRAKRTGGGPERDLTAAAAPLHASGRKPEASERKTLAAMAAEAARWASQQDPGPAAAEDTAI